MKLSKIIEALRAQIIIGHDKLDMDIEAAFGSDLMSDMLNRATEGVLLLTGLTNIQVLRSSVISGVSAIVFVRGKQPNEDIISQAATHGIPLLVTPDTMFTSCGKLYEKGLRGIEDKAPVQ